MAATVTVEPARRLRVLKIQGDASYPAGGYALNSEPFLEAIQGGVNPPVGINDGKTVIARYNLGTQKVEFVTSATGALVATASDQSANTVVVAV